MKRISPFDNYVPSPADYERTNRQAELAESVAKKLKGLPWNFDGSIRIMYKEGYEPEIVVDNLSRSQSMVLLSRACELQHNTTREPHKEVKKMAYPAEWYADVNSADQWDLE